LITCEADEKTECRFQGVYWIVAIAEIAAIIANGSPSSVMKSIVSMLMIGGDPDGLRLSPLSIVGLLSISLGALLRVWCYRVMKDLFTFEITIREDHRLVKNGPYSVVRHPSYAAVLALEIGIFCWYSSHGSWLRESGVLDSVIGKIFFGIFAMMTVGIRVALLKRATIEDMALKKRFGKEWEEWAHRVPYAIVPGVY
jgi:ATP-binding cassette, subfamily G (WHITE), member 2, SNQ2